MPASPRTTTRATAIPCGSACCGRNALTNGWAFTGGQMWSLATEDKKGVSNLASDILTPLTIDPKYVPGFVWERQYGFRVTRPSARSLRHRGRKSAVALQRHAGGQHSLRRPWQHRYGRWTLQLRHQHLLALDQHRELHQRSEWRPEQLSAGLYDGQRLHQRRQLLRSTSLPDLIAKVAYRSQACGHYEIFGIGRTLRDRLPGETTNGHLYGGLKDIVTEPRSPALSTAGSYNNNIALGGSAPAVAHAGQDVYCGSKGLYGPGVGRYGTHHR